MNEKIKKVNERLHPIFEKSYIEDVSIDIDKDKLSCTFIIDDKTIKVVGSVAPNYENYFNLDIEVDFQQRAYSYRFSEMDLDEDLNKVMDSFSGIIKKIHTNDFTISKKKYSFFKAKEYLGVSLDDTYYDFLRTK